MGNCCDPVRMKAPMRSRSRSMRILMYESREGAYWISSMISCRPSASSNSFRIVEGSLAQKRIIQGQVASVGKTCCSKVDFPTWAWDR